MQTLGKSQTCSTCTGKPGLCCSVLWSLRPSIGVIPLSDRFPRSYLTYIKLCTVVKRNESMAHALHAKLKEPQPDESKRGPRPQDLIRLYDIILQVPRACLRLASPIAATGQPPRLPSHPAVIPLSTNGWRCSLRDVIFAFSLLLQSLAELSALQGLEEDHTFQKEVSLKTLVYKAYRWDSNLFDSPRLLCAWQCYDTDLETHHFKFCKV